MNQYKTKLMAAMVSLVLAFSLLSSASYAWFTISTAPEISKLDTSVVVNDNLEIALDNGFANGPVASTTADAGNAYTWGNLLAFGDEVQGEAASAYNTFKETATLRPMKLVQNAFKAPTYDVDGRAKDLNTTLTAGDASGGFGLLKDGNGNAYGYYVDFWLRSNRTGTVQLSEATKRSSDGIEGAGTTFTASGEGLPAQELAKNIRIAFSTDNGTTITEATTTCENNATTATFEGVVADLTTANTAQKVRMYVYIDGENVTNALASLTSAANTGSLNVQFAFDGVDMTSMNAGNAGAQSTPSEP